MPTGKHKQWITDEGLQRITAWVNDGLPMECLAACVGVSPATLEAWRQKFPALEAAIRHGQQAAEVEQALLKVALGYEYCEERTEDNAKGEEKTVRAQKHVSPNVTAQLFWLKNRRPDIWRDKPEAPMTQEEGDDPITKALKEIL